MEWCHRRLPLELKKQKNSYSGQALKYLCKGAQILKFLNTYGTQIPRKASPNIEWSINYRDLTEMFTAALASNRQDQGLCMDTADMVLVLMKGTGA